MDIRLFCANTAAYPDTQPRLLTVKRGQALPIGRASHNNEKNLRPSDRNASFDCPVMSRRHAELNVDPRSVGRLLRFECAFADLHIRAAQPSKTPDPCTARSSMESYLTSTERMPSSPETGSPLAVTLHVGNVRHLLDVQELTNTFRSDPQRNQIRRRVSRHSHFQRALLRRGRGCL